MAETRKAIERRKLDGFFVKYTDGKKVIDIGVGRLESGDGPDVICEHAFPWDKDNGDATDMAGVPDETYDTVFASHILEHLNFPLVAIKNWFRILKPGGHLIMSVPSRDHYEKKKTLPSRWNPDHKFFLTMFENEPPCSFCFMDMIVKALKNGFKVVKYELEITGCTITDPERHSDGEFSIETIIRKL